MGFGGGSGDRRSCGHEHYRATGKHQQPGEHRKITIDLVSSSDEEFGREEGGGFFLMSGRGKPKHKLKEIFMHPVMRSCMISSGCHKSPSEPNCKVGRPIASYRQEEHPPCNKAAILLFMFFVWCQVPN
jgi:hypothetical protein